MKRSYMFDLILFSLLSTLSFYLSYRFLPPGLLFPISFHLPLLTIMFMRWKEWGGFAVVLPYVFGCLFLGLSPFSLLTMICFFCGVAFVSGRLHFSVIRNSLVILTLTAFAEAVSRIVPKVNSGMLLSAVTMTLPSFVISCVLLVVFGLRSDLLEFQGSIKEDLADEK